MRCSHSAACLNWSSAQPAKQADVATVGLAYSDEHISHLHIICGTNYRKKSYCWWKNVDLHIRSDCVTCCPNYSICSYFHLSGYSGCRNGPARPLKPSSTPRCSPSCSTRWREKKLKKQRTENQISSLYRQDERKRINLYLKPYMQHRALLEAKAILEQTSDVGHVHAQEGEAGRVCARLTAHCSRRKRV